MMDCKTVIDGTVLKPMYGAGTSERDADSNFIVSDQGARDKENLCGLSNNCDVVTTPGVGNDLVQRRHIICSIFIASPSNLNGEAEGLVT